jgi:hypothetical protein
MIHKYQFSSRVLYDHLLLHNSVGIIIWIAVFTHSIHILLLSNIYVFTQML